MCNGVFVSDDFLYLVRKLDFNLDDVDELGDCEGNLGVCYYNCGDKFLDVNLGNIIKDFEERLFFVFVLLKFIFLELIIFDLYDVGDMVE